MFGFVVRWMTGIKISSALPTKNSQLGTPFFTTFSLASLIASATISRPNTSPQCWNIRSMSELSSDETLVDFERYLRETKTDSSGTAANVEQRSFLVRLSQVYSGLVENFRTGCIDLKECLRWNSESHTKQRFFDVFRTAQMFDRTAAFSTSFPENTSPNFWAKSAFNRRRLINLQY